MSENSKIEWTDHTFNPWWGCVKVSPACDHCYAERDANRYGFKIWGKDSDRRFFSGKHWTDPAKWDKKAAKEGVRRRVFCGSMCDVMECRSDLDPARERLYGLIERTPNLDWLLLTKRPMNFVKFLPTAWLTNPRPNVWIGTTVESPEYVWRIPYLLQTPAAVRFLSCEPLLGSIDLENIPTGNGSGLHECDPIITMNVLDRASILAPHIHWVIVGGESGPGARPMHPDWARSIQQQCAAAGVPFFFKQWGEWAQIGNTPHMQKVGKKVAGSLLDGREWKEFPTPAPTRLQLTA